MANDLEFDPFYPDVLGAITGDIRINYGDALQGAIGVFPRSAYLNQPVEVIVLLQNLIDQNMEVTVSIVLPNESEDGTKVVIAAPKKQSSVKLSPGEVGALRIPFVPQLPTQPVYDLPVRVLVEYKNRPGKPVRTPTRGAPPSALSVSPFKVQVLRDVEWVTLLQNQSPNRVSATFDIEPKRMPPVKSVPKPSYEVLWSREKMRDEKKNILSQVDEAKVIAATFTRPAIYDSIYRAIDDLYALQGLPLHPGEAGAIAKIMTYTLDDRTRLDPGYKVEEQRWFHTLCQALAADSSVSQWTPGEIVVRYLLEPTIFEAVLLGFNVVRTRVKVNFGDRPERINYANKMMRWLAGQSDPDLIYIYLPLALAGVVVNAQVTWPEDDPWKVIDGLNEAYRGRVRLVEGDAMEIFDILDKLLQKGKDELRRARTTR